MFDMVFLERGAGEDILYRSFCLCLAFIDWLGLGTKYLINILQLFLAIIWAYIR